MISLFDLLKWYSLLDICSFLEAVLEYLDLYRKRTLDLFKMSISLPGILLHWAINTIKSKEKFNLFAPKDSDMAQAMRKNLTGDPSIVFHRC